MSKAIILQWSSAGLGLALLVSAGVLASRTSAFVARAEKVPGRVVDLHGTGTYSPVFTFEYPPGTPHRRISSVGSDPPAYAVGEAVTVLVDPRDPRSAKILGFSEQWLAPLIIGGFGATFGSLGLVLLFLRVRRDAWEALALRHGEKVEARVTRVEQNLFIQVNDRSPWRIFAEGSMGGERREFRSINLWEDPSPYLGDGKVQVYYLPGRPNRYWMDVRFLPERRGKEARPQKK